MAILIVHKDSFLQHFIKEKQENIEITKTIQEAHESHNKALGHVLQICKMYDADVLVLNRSALKIWTQTNNIDKFDLVVTVGGDGTFLSTSHYIKDGVMLGVNSDPVRSVGHFCFAGKDSFERKLQNFDDRKNTFVTRLLVKIGEQELPPILNEILYSHAHPAGMSAYDLSVTKKNETETLAFHSEFQKSSGVFVSTPSGSSGWVKNVGGSLMKGNLGPLSGTGMQYIVRELYFPDASVLKNEILEKSSSVQIKSKTRNSIISIDGSCESYDVQIGDIITVSANNKPLKIVT